MKSGSYIYSSERNYRMRYFKQIVLYLVNALDTGAMQYQGVSGYRDRGQEVV